ncbi:hypothetical protein OG589_11550 [Sphaerisporangium sp. NBC_01403]|uniref:hypothetical protein n=1 Tax=Sphaerisporangium sp. NBC_01403 TaxID=2903599 RepID=UPI003255D512
MRRAARARRCPASSASSPPGHSHPLGNLWWIQTRVEEVGPQEMERRLTDPVFTRAMEYVQSADFFPGRVR